ncbi:MAG TPA: COX15/CtaA family protein [Nocardioidaceae bacterium]|nr:COX15/CtaA family protein [Nocardioidaceae bacterium]
MGVTVQSPPTSSPRPAWAQRWMYPLALTTLAVNILIVVTGGVVRLTASGLGCPTWPRCTDQSFVPHGALGWHGAIEFGNRMVTFLLAAVAIATFVAAWQYGRRSLVRLAFVIGLGVPAQAVIGGITVLTDLNPWVVAFHLLVSMAMIQVAVVLLRRLREGDGPALATVPSGVTWLVRTTFVVGWVVLYLGTIVTGSGPHAGDLDAPRNGLDPAALSQLHTDAVFLLLGLTVGALLALRAVDAPARAVRAAAVLLGLELGQGLVGFVQYFTGLPVVLVGLHLLGSALVAAALAWLLVGVRDRTDAPDAPDAPSEDAAARLGGASAPQSSGG